MAQRCLRCSELIQPPESPVRVSSDVGDEIFAVHRTCFTCSRCSVGLSESSAVVPYKSRLVLCLDDFTETSKSASACRGCHRKCFADTTIVAGEVYHPDCKPTSKQSSPTAYSTLDTSALDLIQDLSGESLTSSHRSFASDSSSFVDDNFHTLPQMHQDPEVRSQFSSKTVLTQYFSNFSPYSQNSYTSPRQLQQQQQLLYQEQLHHQVIEPGELRSQNFLPLLQQPVELQQQTVQTPNSIELVRQQPLQSSTSMDLLQGHYNRTPQQQPVVIPYVKPDLENVSPNIETYRFYKDPSNPLFQLPEPINSPGPSFGHQHQLYQQGQHLMQQQQFVQLQQQQQHVQLQQQQQFVQLQQQQQHVQLQQQQLLVQLRQQQQFVQQQQLVQQHQPVVKQNLVSQQQQQQLVQQLQQQYPAQQLQGEQQQQQPIVQQQQWQPDFQKQQQQHNLVNKQTRTHLSSASSSSSRRNRSTITMDQKVLLEEVWERTRFPSREERVSLGLRTGMDSRQVQIWFQNMRSKAKARNQSL